MNTNNIAGFRNLPVQAIPNNTGNVILVNTGVSQPGLKNGAPLVIQIPPNDTTINGVPFLVRVCGSINMGATGASVLIGQGTGTSVTNRAVSSAVNNSPTGAGATNFCVEYIGVWDSTSLLLNGSTGFCFLDNAATPPASQLNQRTVANANLLQFFPYVTFVDSLPTNTVQIQEFIISQL